MEIFWLGNSDFKIKDKTTTVLVRPDGVLVDDLNFSGPGEYESKGIMITGIKNGNSTIFQVVVDKLNVVFLDRVGTDKEKLEQIEETHILLTPESSVVAELEPKIIVPYAFDGEQLAKLLKELGAEAVNPIPKLSMTKDKLPEEPQVVVLSKS